jgi:hypothetical protein
VSKSKKKFEVPLNKEDLHQQVEAMKIGEDVHAVVVGGRDLVWSKEEVGPVHAAAAPGKSLGYVSYGAPGMSDYLRATYSPYNLRASSGTSLTPGQAFQYSSAIGGYDFSMTSTGRSDPVVYHKDNDNTHIFTVVFPEGLAELTVIAQSKEAVEAIVKRIRSMATLDVI